MKTKEKTFLTNGQLIEKLKQQGLIIENEKHALQFLNEVGYYKLINGYKHCFKYVDASTGCSKYYDKTTFKNIVAVYDFDFKLKNLIFKNICIIENTLKSQIASVFSSKYGVDDKKYFIAENFKADSTSEDKRYCLENIKKEFDEKINKNIKTNDSIKHYAQLGYYPLWVLMNIVSFGTMCIFYKKLKPEDQVQIAHYFNIPKTVLENFLSHLVLFRNACAHNEVVFNFHTQNRLKQDKCTDTIYQTLGIEKNQHFTYRTGINNLLSLIIVFKKLLSKDKFDAFLSKFLKLLKTLKSKKINEIPMQNIKKCMGILNIETNLKRLLNK